MSSTARATASSSALARVVFLLLVAATVGAFFVTQRLKRSGPVVKRLATPLYISPNGDGRKDTARITFTLPKTDLAAAEPILEQLAKEVAAKGVVYDPDIAKVSLVGAGMKSHPGVAADMFEALAEAGINIEIISTSSIRVSCVVRAAQVEEAVRAVHERFRLFAEERLNG